MEDNYIPSEEEAFNYNVYWIHLPEHIDIRSEGYVGITNNLKERFGRHKATARNVNRQRSVHLENAINKYPDLIYDTVMQDCEMELAQLIELELRPLPNIGWNIAIGGGLPPCMKGELNPFYGKSHSEETIIKIKCTIAEQDRAGVNNNNADTTIYTFVHNDGDTVTCTRYEFEQRFNFTLKPLFRKNNQTKTRKGWRITNGR